MAVKPIPAGYIAVTPYLIVDGAAAAIDFYTRAFGAKERSRYEMSPGKIGHAEIQIGDAIVMLADQFPEMGFVAPSGTGASTLMHHYVEDVDAVFRQAISAGAKEVMPVKDEFYGDRTGTLRDPFGHVWTISTRKEDLTKEEMRRRGEEAMKQYQK